MLFLPINHVHKTPSIPNTKDHHSFYTGALWHTFASLHIQKFGVWVFLKFLNILLVYSTSSTGTESLLVLQTAGTSPVRCFLGAISDPTIHMQPILLMTVPARKNLTFQGICISLYLSAALFYSLYIKKNEIF